MAAVSKKASPIEATKLETGVAKFCLLGTSPFIYNAVSQKAMMEFLYPRSGRMSAGMKATRLKHDPIQEYRNSVYATKFPTSPSLLQFPAGAFKKACASAALDMPTSVKKAQIGRLVWAPEEWVPIFGKPSLYMTVVKSSDIARTPDVRTRARLDRWATMVTLKYVSPNLNAETLGLLMHGAGIIIGVGDGRQERGSLSYGQFQICDPKNAEFLDILNEGYEVQRAAMEAPEANDQVTADLLEWFSEELVRRRDKKKKDEEEEAEEVEEELEPA